MYATYLCWKGDYSSKIAYNSLIESLFLESTPMIDMLHIFLREKKFFVYNNSFRIVIS